MSQEHIVALEELNGAIKKYRVTYKQHQSANADLDMARTAAQALYATEADQEQIWRTFVTEADTELRAAILAAYQATGNTKPAPGVGIRETTTYQYDPAAALAWCLEHRVGLQLDTKAFEALCKHPSTRPDFVQVVKTPTATIGAVLKGE